MRAICEGEIDLRGTPAAEEGGLHMGWNGTDMVFVRAARWRKCLGRLRFTRALFAHVRVATLQVPQYQGKRRAIRTPAEATAGTALGSARLCGRMCPMRLKVEHRFEQPTTPEARQTRSWARCADLSGAPLGLRS